MVYTKVVTNKSPWLAEAKLGGVYTNPASHGEGRFVASEEWIDKLFANGQVATQYCSPEGHITMDEEWNVNGSYHAIEGIKVRTVECSEKWLTLKEGVILLRLIFMESRILRFLNPE